MSNDAQRPESSSVASVPETDGAPALERQPDMITDRILARIEAKLRSVPGVLEASAVAAGQTIAATVRGGADQDIRDALLDSVPDGIQTSGDICGTAADSEGTKQTMRFSRSYDA